MSTVVWRRAGACGGARVRVRSVDYLTLPPDWILGLTQSSSSSRWDELVKQPTLASCSCSPSMSRTSRWGASGCARRRRWRGPCARQVGRGPWGSDPRTWPWQTRWWGRRRLGRPLCRWQRGRRTRSVIYGADVRWSKCNQRKIWVWTGWMTEPDLNLVHRISI
jgi:hypothetical protein